MAEKEVELAQTPAKSGKLKWILLGVGAIALVGGSVGATLIFTGVLGDSGTPAPAEAAPQGREEALYVSLVPPFTVNFPPSSGAHYLKIGVDIVTRDRAVELGVKRHIPAVREALTLVFSGKSAEELATLEGKKALQEEAKEAVQEVLANEEELRKGVETVYFTTFVMQ